jgi:hypothetical protein
VDVIEARERASVGREELEELVHGDAVGDDAVQARRVHGYVRRRRGRRKVGSVCRGVDIVSVRPRSLPPRLVALALDVREPREQRVDALANAEVFRGAVLANHDEVSVLRG